MNSNFEIKINRSIRRNSVALIVKDNTLYVKAPFYISEKTINNIITIKKKWITKKFAEDNILRGQPIIKYNNGDILLFKGKQYKLNVKEFSSNKVELPNTFFNVYINESYQNKVIIKDTILKWYFYESKYYLNKTITYYKNLMDVSVNDIKISEYKSKWGSCNKAKNLTFDWRIIMAPEQVLRYLVVHELSHIRHPNHSLSFWRNVESFMPSFNIHRKWLSKNGKFLLRYFD